VGDTQNRPAVWDGDFQAVWHLAETVGGTNAIKDSTARANSGTDLGGTMLGMPGKVGPAARFDGVDDHIRVPSSSAFTPVYQAATLSLWVSFTDPTTTDYQRILLATNSLTGDGRGFEWGTNPLGDYYYYPEGAGGLNYAAVTSPFGDGTWHHVAITQSFATKMVELYVDGTLRTPTFNQTPVNWAQVMTAADWHWGGTPTRTQFAGRMDEIHVSKVVRSAGWIATEYANQNEPALFYRVE
jgi:Concanavalin A-like lectin/glucanases superfamily